MYYNKVNEIDFFNKKITATPYNPEEEIFLKSLKKQEQFEVSN